MSAICNSVPSDPTGTAPELCGKHDGSSEFAVDRCDRFAAVQWHGVLRVGPGKPFDDRSVGGDGGGHADGDASRFRSTIQLTHLRPHLALAIDVVAALTQLLLLVSLALTGWLNAWTALLTMGLGCGLAGLGWFLASRQSFGIRRRQLRGDSLRNWRIGKWVFASQLCSIINCYGVHWLIAWFSGAAAAGLFVGSTAIVQMASPFILGMHNLISPRMAAAEAESGNAGLRQVLIPATMVMAIAMLLFTVGIILFGEWLTTGIYGAEFSGHHMTTVLFAIAVSVATIAMPADRVLWIGKHPEASFRTAALGLLVTLVTTLALISTRGIEAGAIGILAGYLATALARWFAVWQLGIVGEKQS